MKSEEVTLGRTFILKFDHGDDLLKELEAFIKHNDIQAGTIQLLGALKKAEVVVGPEKDELPPTPIWKKIEKANEVIGIGTIFWEEGQPKIHIHASAGHDKDTIVACIRKDTEVFIVIEAIIQEYESTTAKREPDKKTGMSLLTFGE